MRFLWRWIKRLLLLVVVLVLALLALVAYIEAACRGEVHAADYNPILPASFHRPESRTLLTYPEWHIVHAYDDYAEVIRDGDPHDYRFLSAITGFWGSLCALSEQSAQHGGFQWETKQMVYTIGVSFSAELALKALYEETFGRIATLVRGETHAPLDTLSADQAAAYAAFLQQVPWHQWDFTKDADALDAANSDTFRDRERNFALGTEFGVKAAYAKVIAAAVENIGPDELTLRMVVSGLSDAALTGFDGVSVVGGHTAGTIVETPRYRALTHLLVAMAEQGAEFVEIAGNDDIMFTVIADGAIGDALFSFDRQGYGDQRHLMFVKVPDLAKRLRELPEGVSLEHIHDY